MRLFHSLYHEDGKLLATGEHMLLHVSLKTRRATLPSESIANVLNQITSLHSQLPMPVGLGKGISDV